MHLFYKNMQKVQWCIVKSTKVIWDWVWCYNGWHEYDYIG